MNRKPHSIQGRLNISNAIKKLFADPTKNPNWKGGKPKCVDCGASISYVSTRCRKCAFKFLTGKKKDSTNAIRGINHHLYKHGKSTTKKFCKCGKQISWRAEKCQSCESKTRIAERNGNYGKKHPGLNAGTKSCMYGKPPKHGKRTIYNNVSFRSTWEAGYARYLYESNITWQYEQKFFPLSINNKDVSFTPDFYLPNTNEFKEVKGWWRDDAKTKYQTFLKTFPEIKITIVEQFKLRELNIIGSNGKLRTPIKK